MENELLEAECEINEDKKPLEDTFLGGRGSFTIFTTRNSTRLYGEESRDTPFILAGGEEE